jgi:hypothetical protein
VGGSVRASFVATLIGFALLVAACSGGDDVVDLDDAIGPESTTTTSSTTSTTSSTTTEAPKVEEPDDAEAAVIETWTSLLDAARTGTPDDEQVALIESLAGTETVEQLLAPLFPAFPNREIEFFPALTAQDDGTYAIDDCLVMNRGITAEVSNWFVGAAEPSDDSPTGYVVTDISVINLDPCVPRSIADAAIEGYETYWDAFDTIFDPSQSDSGLLGETTTNPYRDFAAGLVDQFEEDGQVLRGRPETAPEFFEISSTAELIIIDCQTTNPELGVYDASTGERTDLVPPISDGQTDVREATMKLEGGIWKVADLQGVVDVQCGVPEPLPTLQVSGG